MNRKKNEYYSLAVFGFLTVLILLINFRPLFSSGKYRITQQYINRRVTTEHGLPQNTVYDITQDHDGYVWIGTDKGMVRFDGVRFLHFNKDNTPNIENDSITALFTAHDGTVWIGTFGGGILMFKDKTLFAYSTENGLPNDFIWTIMQDSKFYIWLGTVGGGLIRYKDNRFDIFNTNDGLSNNIINAVFEDRRGKLWIGTENGLNCMDDSSIRVYTTADGLADNRVMSVIEDSRGVLWIGTTMGLTAMKDDGVITYTTKHGLSNNIIRSVFEDSERNLWVATDDGLNRIGYRDRFSKDNIKIEPFAFGDDVARNSLMRIFQDRENNLWIGSSGAGLNILHRRKLQAYTTDNGLTRNHIKAVYQAPDGAMWIGTNGGGLNLMKGGNFNVFSVENGLGSNFINTILVDRKGNLWVGTAKGLALYENDSFKTFTGEDGLSAEDIRVLYEDLDGTLWVGTYGGGLNSFDRNEKSFRHVTVKDGLSNNFVLSIAEDGKQNLWIGTNKGLNRLKGKRVETYGSADGLSNEMVYDIYIDKTGVLWLGTNGGGLSRFDDGTFTNYTSASGLYNDTIYRIIEDDKNNLWMSSNKGIFVAAMRELEQIRRGTLSRLNCVYFGEEDGMLSSVCTGGFQPAGVKTINGRIWFPTIHGVVLLDPQNLAFNEVEPPVHIEQVVVNGLSRRLGRPLKLPADTVDIKITFTAPSFTAPGKVRFRYRLKGHSDKWFETYSRKRVEYSNLPPGRYTFEVTACNNDGVWSSKSSTAVFGIRPYFHQTFWFYLLLALVFSAAGFYLYRRSADRIKELVGEDDRYKASNLSQPKGRTYLKQLQKYMKEEKPFLDPDLTADSLAEAVGISKKHLSQTINQHLNCNFSNFINEYRVREAKKMLVDPKEQDFVLLKIGLDVGFNSKSAFNNAFKKFTRMTPGQYRDKHFKKEERDK